MSRYRSIHVAIWSDDKFPFLGDDARLAFFHLLTTPASTPFGLFKISLSYLADEIRWPLDRYRVAFDELVEAGMVAYDSTHLCVALPRHLPWNPPMNPNVLTSWGRIAAELPACAMKDAWLQELKAFAERRGKGFKDAYFDAFSKGLPKGARKGYRIQEQDKDKDKDKEQRERPPQKPRRRATPTDLIDHQFNDAERAIITNAGLDPDHVQKTVQDWAANKPPSKRAMKDVPAFLRNWIARERPNTGRRGNGPDHTTTPAAYPEPSDFGLADDAVCVGALDGGGYQFDVPGQGIVTVTEDDAI